MLISGENELLCVVYRWSTGTYLECQDMFRENGIFRDVLLYTYDKAYINDYEVKTRLNGGREYDLDIDVFLEGEAAGKKFRQSFSQAEKDMLRRKGCRRLRQIFLLGTRRKGMDCGNAECLRALFNA